MKVTAQPMPITARATLNMKIESATANRVAPAIPTAIKHGTMRRGPNLSNNSPFGSYMAANVMKKTDARRLNPLTVKSSSAIKSGPITA